MRISNAVVCAIAALAAREGLQPTPVAAASPLPDQELTDASSDDKHSLVTHGQVAVVVPESRDLALSMAKTSPESPSLATPGSGVERSSGGAIAPVDGSNSADPTHSADPAHSADIAGLANIADAHSASVTDIADTVDIANSADLADVEAWAAIPNSLPELAPEPATPFLAGDRSLEWSPSNPPAPSPDSPSVTPQRSVVPIPPSIPTAAFDPPPVQTAQAIAQPISSAIPQAIAQPADLAPVAEGAVRFASSRTDQATTGVRQPTWAIAQRVQLQPMTAQQVAQLPTIPSTFDTVQGHWARDFVVALEQAGIVQGFRETGTIRPDLPMTRAQYAALLQQAFSVSPIRDAVSFSDVPANHWAREAIASAYRMGFLNGVGNGRFSPDAPLSRAEAVQALVTGLRITGGNESVLQQLRDAATIPANARQAIAHAMDGQIPPGGAEARLVVNYPDVAIFNPNRSATRGEVMAMVHQALVATGELNALGDGAIARQYIANLALPSQPGTSPPIAPVTMYVPDLSDLQREQDRLDRLSRQSVDRSAPAFTIANPSGFGVDNWTSFFGASFQSQTRYGNESDGGLVFGIGMGDAREAVGVELSYTVASFGGSRDFGTGGLNLRIHRQFSEDFAGAIGWNGIATTGEVDFQDSIYGVLTKILTLDEDINDPFSRIALTFGIGNGMFRSEEDATNDNDTVGVFGSVAIRIAEPVSLITEWTGQDLAIGLSIAPFRDRNFVITPAIRDITGAGDEARFVLGTGFSF